MYYVLALVHHYQDEQTLSTQNGHMVTFTPHPTSARDTIDAAAAQDDDDVDD